MINNYETKPSPIKRHDTKRGRMGSSLPCLKIDIKAVGKDRPEAVLKHNPDCTKGGLKGIKNQVAKWGILSAPI